MAEIGRVNGHRFTGPLPFASAGIPPAKRPNPEALAYDLEAALSAVFTLRSTVPEDAFTAGTLGTEREGNGILIGNDGLVLTIGYLIAEAAAVTLADSRGREIPARAIAYDQESGLGLVRALERPAAAALPRGTAGTLAVGDTVVLAAGGGAKQALLAEIASKREFAGYWEYLLEEAVFTVPPHPHWSGAALLDDRGRLCGVGSLYVQDARNDAGSVSGNMPGNMPGNMIVPIDLLEPILADLVATGRSGAPPRPWLGMFTSETDDGLIVAGLVQGGPAHRGGVRLGDILLALEGRPVARLADFYRRVWSCGGPGTAVRLRLAREGRLVTATVRTGDRYARLRPPRS